jgi:hypothetical protein
MLVVPSLALNVDSAGRSDFRCWPEATDIAAQANVGCQGYSGSNWRVLDMT